MAALLLLPLVLVAGLLASTHVLAGYDGKPAEHNLHFQKVKDLLQRLENFENETKQPIRKVKDLHQRLENFENETKQLIRKDEDADKKLNQSLAKIRELEEKVKLLNGKVAELVLLKRCTLENRHEILKAVQEYNRTNDWEPLSNSLNASLDHSSLAYIQLQDVANNPFPAYVIGSKGHKDLAEVLVYCGAGVNMTDSDNYTMLHAAAIDNQHELVKFLLDNGADTEARTVFNHTPLMRAASYSHLEIVKLLVQAGANTTARDTNNRTSLEIASNWWVVQYLSQFPH